MADSKEPGFTGFEVSALTIGGQLFPQLSAVSVYIFALLAVGKMRRNDKNIAPFYTFYFYIGLMDVFHAFIQIFMHLVLNCWIGERTEFLAHCYDVASNLTCILYHCHLLGNSIMAINRYSATFTFHHKHFSKRIVNCLLTLTVVISVALSIPAMLVRRDYNPITGKYQALPESFVKTQRYIIIATMINFALVAVLFSYLAWRRIKYFIHADKYHRSDQNLLYMVVIHLFLHFWLLLFEIGEAFTPDSPLIQFAQRHYFIFFYMITVSNGFILPSTSPRVKREIVKLLCSKAILTNKVNSSNPQIITVQSKY